MKLASIVFLAVTGLAGCADPGTDPHTSVESRELVAPSCDCGTVTALKWSTDITNYWQRHFYVGIRLKRLFASSDQRNRNPYYFDNSSITGSPVLPEVH